VNDQNLAPGTRVGPYEVAAPLGAGGMGVVYRARDTRLGRDVALKTLPASLAADAERLRRFELEARSTGVLNHPNILAVFDVGSHEGAPYVVSELLEGDTLRDRLAGGALAMRKAVEYAVQIARGLAAAHDKGIVHRDLKPENVFVTRDGRVKILDFGLAKLAPTGGSPDSVTRELPPGTDAGTVLGTAGYMSPEQVRGQSVDHRSDIFAFGAVLYEMLSGRRAFRGNSAVETLHAILKEDPPPLTETNPQLPQALERIVAHCLEKTPEERFQSARDIAFHLEQLSGASASAPLVSAAPPRRWLRPVLGAAAVLWLMAAGYALGTRRQADPGVVSFRPITFQQGFVRDARFGPDGRQVYYQARWVTSETADVYVATPGTPEARALGLGTFAFGGVSRSNELLVGRSETGTIAQVPAGGGAPRDIAEGYRDTDWAPDGSIAGVRISSADEWLEFPLGRPLARGSMLLFPRVSRDGSLVVFTEHPLAGDFGGNVMVVDKSGQVRRLSGEWRDIRGLAWSADGREVWFTATRAGAESALWAVTLGGAERLVFRAPGSLAVHDIAADGRVLLSVQRRRPVVFGLAPGETVERNLSWLDHGSAVSISDDGRLLLVSEQGEGGGAGYSAYLRPMNGAPPVRLGQGEALALSPDGTLALLLDVKAPMQVSVVPTGMGPPRALPRGPLVQIHAGAFLPGNTAVVLVGTALGQAPRLWVQDLSGGDPRPVTPEGYTSWTREVVVRPDGRFGVANDEDGDVVLVPLAGGELRNVAGARKNDEPITFLADGRRLVVRQQNRAGARPLFVVDIESGTRQPWASGPKAPPAGGVVWKLRLSRDGKTYAYTLREDTSTLYLAEGLR
jgi:eukaryotic-like serine/threonine-protein kinase